MGINSTDKLKKFTASNRLTYVVSPSLRNNHSNSTNINENSQKVGEVVLAKGDSAASHHYWREQDKRVRKEIKEFTGPSVLIPNGDFFSTKKVILPLSAKLSTAASTAMILPGLTSTSFVSIGKLCDDGCDIFLNKKILIAVK